MSELSDAIFELIVAGEYLPGEKLNEVDVAGRLGVSRTPVREALKSLANTGVVIVEKNKGARVAEHSQESVEAAYAARSLIEPSAAKLATGHLTGEDLASLRELAEKMYASVTGSTNIADISTMNNEFHAAILARCPNRHIAEIAMGMLKPIVASRTFRSYTPTELLRSAVHHLEIVDALECGDAEWVEAIMRAHIRSGLHRARGRTEPPSERISR